MNDWAITPSLIVGVWRALAPPQPQMWWGSSPVPLALEKLLLRAWWKGDKILRWTEAEKNESHWIKHRAKEINPQSWGHYSGLSMELDWLPGQSKLWKDNKNLFVNVTYLCQKRKTPNSVALRTGKIYATSLPDDLMIHQQAPYIEFCL